jgi:hypothetical protein
LYLRNVKQILRQAAPPLDERAYGFAQITDLVRAAQREGFLRVERDRQGVVRVSQGPAYDAVAGGSSPSGIQTPEDTTAADVPASTDVDHEFAPMASASGGNETASSDELDVRAETDVDGNRADAVPEPGESPAPTRKRRPNRGTGRRRPAAKK